MSGPVVVGVLVDPAARKAWCSCGAVTVRPVDELERWAREHQLDDPRPYHLAYLDDDGPSYLAGSTGVTR